MNDGSVSYIHEVSIYWVIITKILMLAVFFIE